jgi:hypothetical protein
MDVVILLHVVKIQSTYSARFINIVAATANRLIIMHHLFQTRQTNAAHLFLQVGEEYKLWFGMNVEIID